MSKQIKPISKAFAYGYGLGEMGFTFFNFLVAYYLMYYLTDVLCLPMVLAASLYSGIQWVEVATMLAAGVLIDKSRLRSGKYRPWIVGGSILCAINLVLFYTDFGLKKTLAAILFTLTYFLCYCGYNTMWVAYRALLGPLCHSPKDSVVITTSASQLSSVAGLIFSALGAKILYGCGIIQQGYLVSSLLCGGIMVGAMLVVSHLVRPFDGSAADDTAPPVTVKELLRGVNRHTIVFFLAVTFREAVQTIFPTLLVYYFTYTLGNPQLISVYLTTITITTLVGYTFADKLAVHFGKRTMFLISSLVSCAALAAINWAANLTAFLALIVVYMFCSIFSGAMIPAFMNDIAVYNEASYGIRGHAFSAAIGGGAIRLSQVLGGAMASFGLVFIGYTGSGAMSAEVSAKVPGLMTWGSVAVVLASTLIFCFYRLDEKTLEQAYEQISAS